MGQYQHITYRAITMLRGALISMLYKKATQLNSKDVDPASSITLMSADIERIVQGWQTVHEIWANIIEVGVAIYLLDLQLGVACVVPIGVSISKCRALIFQAVYNKYEWFNFNSYSGGLHYHNDVCHFTSGYVA